MDDSRGSRHRRASSRSVMPLATIAASFFLPTLQTCQTMDSPMKAVGDGLVFVIPWYLAALILAVVTALAALKLRTPGRGGWIAGVMSVVACGLVALIGLVAFVYELPTRPMGLPEWFAASVLVFSVGVGTSALLGARVRVGWSAWTRLLFGYWAYLLPLLGIFGLAALEDPSLGSLGPGAYFVLLAAATLGVLLGGAVLTDRRER